MTQETQGRKGAKKGKRVKNKKILFFKDFLCFFFSLRLCAFA
jgi:hypothetical protein